jgi:hypothetical protein
VAALISSGATKVSADVTGERKPSGARKVVRVLLNTIGIGAAAGGTYFTVLVVSAILDIIGLVRSNPKKELQEPRLERHTPPWLSLEGSTFCSSSYSGRSQ